MKTFFNEFKAFIARGNVLDLAVGIIIGAAFTSIVNSLVNDILMPPIGLALNGVDFNNLYINLGDGEYESLAAAQEAGAPTINYGNFINEIIEFIIIAFVVFLLVRWFNRIRTGMEGEVAPGEPTTKACPYCYAAVPIKASRCPQCTSHLDDPQAAPPAANAIK